MGCAGAHPFEGVGRLPPDRARREGGHGLPARRVAARRLRLVVCASLFLAPAPALAEFTVCNQTLDVANVAIGKEFGSDFRTEGWWTIAANQCVDVIKSPLTSRYVYVYATDVFQRPLLSGATQMCVRPRRFTIDGIDACWQRGLQAARFAEVDTKAVERWTVFLRDPAATDPR